MKTIFTIILTTFLTISCSSQKITNDFIFNFSFYQYDHKVPDRTIEYNSENGVSKFREGLEITTLILPLSQIEKETLLKISSENFNMCLKYEDNDLGTFYTNYKLKFKNNSPEIKCKEELASEKTINSKEVRFYYKLRNYLKERKEYQIKFPEQFEVY